MSKIEKDLLWKKDSDFNISCSSYSHAYYNMPDLHYHKHYEILLVFENDRILLTNNSRTTLNRNNILLMPPFVLHRTISGNQPHQKSYLINFTSEIAGKIKKIINIDVELLFNTNNFTLPLSEESADFVISTISTLYQEKQKGGVTGNAVAFLIQC